METKKEVSVDFEKVITDKAEETRTKFRALLDKTNKEHPSPKDLKALSDLLSDNKKLELWRDVLSAGHLAELMFIENAHATAGPQRVLEASATSLKERPRLRRRATIGEAVNSASRVVLAET